MRKALILVAATVVSMAAMTATANATSIRKASTGVLCPAVSVSGNTVSGGCLVENNDGGWTMMNPYTSPPSVVTSCTLNIDFRINGTGTTLYAVDQINSCTGYNRVACTDNTTGAKLPWPSTYAVENGVVVYRMNTCIENPANPSVHTWEQVPLTPKPQDWQNVFRGFNQNGTSQTGSIAGVSLDQLHVASRIIAVW